MGTAIKWDKIKYVTHISLLQTGRTNDFLFSAIHLSTLIGCPSCGAICFGTVASPFDSPLRLDITSNFNRNQQCGQESERAFWLVTWHNRGDTPPLEKLEPFSEIIENHSDGATVIGLFAESHTPCLKKQSFPQRSEIQGRHGSSWNSCPTPNDRKTSSRS